jgi:hypothetical protein
VDRHQAIKESGGLWQNTACCLPAEEKKRKQLGERALRQLARLAEHHLTGGYPERTSIAPDGLQFLT